LDLQQKSLTTLFFRIKVENNFLPELQNPISIAMENHSASLSPEEIELVDKKKELAILEEELSQRELDSATVNADLLAFERKYFRLVGRLFADLDDLEDIEARIAELEANLNPTDKEAQEKAKEALHRSIDSQKSISLISDGNKKEKFEPSDNLKKLYRQAAKTVHPDLATEINSQHLRQLLMAELNLAYEKGDEEKIIDIIRQWETSPEAVEGDGVEAELTRVIRKIAQVQNRLLLIDSEIMALKDSTLWNLKKECDSAEEVGRDLLSEMAENLNAKILAAKGRLSKMEKKQNS